MHLRATLLGLAVVAFACPVSADGTAVLSYGCGGGVTGGGQGAVIHRDGRISRWTIERGGAPRDERTLAQNREGVARLLALLQDLNFEDIDFNHPHYNRRCSLTLTTNGSDHTVSWGHGGFPVPPDIERIAAEVEKLSAIPGR